MLGKPYRAETIELADDDEGEVVATLVHRPSRGPRGKAVLHVHGFADYFFQTPAADYWVARGYDFYALDLRKYGRSLREHQTPNFVTDLTAYYEEIDEAYRRDHRARRARPRRGHARTPPVGWSRRCGCTTGSPRVAAMVLNSPWLDLQGSLLLRTAGTKAIDQIGARRPYLAIPRDVSGFYARSLHRDHDGEWDFDLAWKPLESWPVYAGWLRAVRRGHARAHRGLDVPGAGAGADVRGERTPQGVRRDVLEHRHRARRRADPEVGPQARRPRHAGPRRGRAARRDDVPGSRCATASSTRSPAGSTPTSADHGAEHGGRPVGRPG